MLQETSVREYFREGYLLLPGLVRARTVERVLQAGGPEQIEGVTWRASVLDRHDLDADRERHLILIEPAVISVVETLLEDTVRVWYGMFAAVPPGGDGLPWHQDNMYTRLLGRALNVFVALTPVHEQNAGLWLSPRSHWYGTLPAERNETTAPGHREAVAAPENGVPLPPMAPGDAVVFDRLMLHRSGRNHGDRPRLAYAAQYLADHTRLAESGAKDVSRIPVRELADRWGEPQG